MHRSWGPLEPFDDSAFRILHNNGIHSHLVSDHGHYWECGGATYHTQYSTWENIRGQEGDAWAAIPGGAEDAEPNFVPFTEGLRGELYQQNLANRTKISREQDFPLIKTFNAGMEFLEQNSEKDSWFLQIESFSPHEPFMASKEFKNMYPGKEKGKKYEWPDYAPVKESQEEIDEVKYSYFADLSMCDRQLGRILDLMDEKNLWEDTMLIINTDHGYMLGEHGYWAKNYMPCYDEIAHTPLFIWNPRFPQLKGIHRKSMVQTIDLPVTILKFFGIEPTKDMQGHDLALVMENDTKIRECGLFGTFGAHICCTDGRYVYMRAPRNTEVPLNEYTLMPTHMMHFFSAEELSGMQRHDGFPFTKDCPVMQIPVNPAVRCITDRDYLFDLEKDQKEECSVVSEEVTKYMETQMRLLMKETDVPEEVFKRFGL